MSNNSPQDHDIGATPDGTRTSLSEEKQGINDHNDTGPSTSASRTLFPIFADTILKLHPGEAATLGGPRIGTLRSDDGIGTGLHKL